MGKNLAKVYSYKKEYIVKPDETGFEYKYSYLKAHRNNRTHTTKMEHDSLPEYFCNVHRYGVQYNVIDSRGVTKLSYRWFKMNHFMRDSSLKVYFDNNEEEEICVYGYEIFKYLAYVKKYSNYDISAIREEFIKQCNWLAENEPDCVPETDDFGKWFDNELNEYEE